MSWSFPSIDVDWSEIDDLRTIPPKGYYRVNIHKAVQIATKAGGHVIKFHCRIIGGSHDGCWIHDVMTLPTSSEDTKLKYWKPLVVALQAQGKTMSQETLAGLDAQVIWTPRNKDAQYDSIKFLKEDIWIKEKAEADRKAREKKEREQTNTD